MGICFCGWWPSASSAAREKRHDSATGGDEFGILPAGPTDLAGAAAIAWKVQQALAPTFVVHGVETEVTASIGIALLPDHGDNIADLLRRAAGIAKGAGNPIKDKVGKITAAQLLEIAELKMKDLNAIDVAGAQKQIEGTARSMGIEIVA